MCVKSIRADFVCVTSRTLLREKYPFTEQFGNMNAVPLSLKLGGGGGQTPERVSNKSFIWKMHSRVQTG